MNTNKLRQLAAHALALATILDGWDEAATKIADKLTAAPVTAKASKAKRVRRSVKSKAAKAVAVTASPAVQPAKKRAKRSARVARPSVPGKPQESVDNTEAVMRAIQAGHTTKAAIIQATKASEGRVGLALMGLRKAGHIQMAGTKRTATYSLASRSESSVSNGAMSAPYAPVHAEAE